ncbi:U32 family peptidase [bacterium]|nr:U32 family peptidase [bacterium]
MKYTELLAPAKDKQTAIIAINSGCDALYIGAPKFGARQNAGNSLEDIQEIVQYAHKFNVKVHVTINTILTDSELAQAKQLIQKLYEIGVDALIVQDMGILKASIDGEIPPIPIHMSTQCDNRNLEKVKFFDQVGTSRVILARETSLETIKEICTNTKTEIETFIHGALCVSYSGQCYLSCSIGGRSANRGECAQSCRKKYSLVDQNGKFIAKDLHLLSLKDFNASKHLKNLTDAGVKSFKIEGRLKDENYVKNVVAYYRNELDKISKKTSSGKIFLDFEPDVNKSFNRGFTDYFLDGRKQCFNFNTPKSLGEKLGKIEKVDKNCFILNSKINPQDGLCFFVNGELKGCLVNKIEGNKIFPNKMDGIKTGIIVYRNFNSAFEKQLTNSKTKRQIGVEFVYKNNVLSAIDEDNNNVHIKIINSEFPKNPDKMKEVFSTQLNKTGESDFYVTDIKIKSDLPFLPISEINNLRREILEKLMACRLKNYKHERQQPMKYVDFPKKELDYRANIHNSQAKCFYENCNSKVCEMSYESTKPKNVELMRTKHCLKFAFNMCKSPSKLFLIDEKGKKYPLNFDCKNCEMVIIG